MFIPLALLSIVDHFRGVGSLGADDLDRDREVALVDHEPANAADKLATVRVDAREDRPPVGRKTPPLPSAVCWIRVADHGQRDNRGKSFFPIIIDPVGGDLPREDRNDVLADLA